jgi:hypothetical protein
LIGIRSAPNDNANASMSKADEVVHDILAQGRTQPKREEVLVTTVLCLMLAENGNVRFAVAEPSQPKTRPGLTYYQHTFHRYLHLDLGSCK